MSAAFGKHAVFDALREADAAHECSEHECSAPNYLFREQLGELTIYCAGCGETIWRES